MARHADEPVVLNRPALRAKYGSGGYQKVRAALRDLSASDRARGLSSRVLVIDDGRSMRSSGGTAVSDPGDAFAAKKAVDAAASALTPHFLVLSGAPDVLAQQRLRTPTPDDDPDLPSDLPYGCPVGPCDDPGDSRPARSPCRASPAHRDPGLTVILSRPAGDRARSPCRIRPGFRDLSHTVIMGRARSDWAAVTVSLPSRAAPRGPHGDHVAGEAKRPDKITVPVGVPAPPAHRAPDPATGPDTGLGTH